MTFSAQRAWRVPRHKLDLKPLCVPRPGGTDGPDRTSRSPPPQSSPASPPPQSPDSASSPASPSSGSKSSGGYVPPAPYLRGNQGSGSCDDQQPPGSWSCTQQVIIFPVPLLADLSEGREPCAYYPLCYPSRHARPTSAV
jgi:hypothetical protein